MNKAPHRLISPKPNDLIDGHLIVTPAIARGASGVVHEAIDPHGRRCALKILDRESIIKRHKEGYQFQHQSPDEEEKEGRALYEKMVLHFKEEYQILIGLSHLNVAQAYHFGCVDGHFYFTTEFIEGKPISRYAWRQKPLDMIPLFLQALEGLDFIHRNNLLHLDLKPENVLVQEMSGQAHVKIIDFGLALKPSAYGGKMRGTTYYMAPEIIVNEGKPIDERTDLFSFGALMYFCMTWGRLPFPRTTSRNKEALRQLVQKEKLLRLPSAHHLLHPEFVPPFLDIIVARLLERDPEHRIFLSSRAVINALKTHEPERFREERDHRSAYLIPKGNKHIGREEEQTKLFGLLDGLLQNSAKQPPMVMIEGASGLGKTHLLNKLRERASVHADQLFVSHLALPADDLATQRFCSDVEQKLAENTKPVVVLIDDVDPSFTFLSRLTSFIHTRRAYPELYANTPSILLCVTMSDNGSPTLPAGRQVKTLGDDVCRLTLKPFTLLDLDTYLDSTPAFEHHKPDHTWLEDLHRRTGGIPALIREHLEHIDSKHMLFDLTGKIVMHPTWPEAKDLQHLEGIRSRMEHALSSCHAEEKKILAILAVWNHLHFAPPATFHDVFHFFPLTTLKQKLDRLIEHGLVVSSPENFCFANDLLGSLVYGQLSPEERWYWHGEMAKYLTSSDLLLLHLAHTNPSATAHRALLKLARKRFIHHGDVALARSLLEYALTIVPAGRPNLFACFASVLMEVYQQSGEVQKAEQLYIDALKSLPHEALWHVRLKMKRIGLLLGQHRLENAETGITELMQCTDHFQSTPLFITTLNYRGRLCYEKALVSDSEKRALLQQAKEMFEKSRRLEMSLQGHAQSNIGNNTLGLVLMALGEYQEAVTELGKQLSKFKKQEHLLGVLRTLLDLAEAFRQLKHCETAKTMAEQALELAKRTKQGKWLLHAHHALSHLYHDSNRFQEALQEADACLAASAVLEDPSEQRMTSLAVWTHKGHCHKELRDLNKAILHFQSVLEANASPAFLVSAHEGLGETYFYQQAFPESQRHFEQAALLLERLPPDAMSSYRAAITAFQHRLLAEAST